MLSVNPFSLLKNTVSYFISCSTLGVLKFRLKMTLGLTICPLPYVSPVLWNRFSYLLSNTLAFASYDSKFSKLVKKLCLPSAFSSTIFPRFEAFEDLKIFFEVVLLPGFGPFLLFILIYIWCNWRLWNFNLF